MKSNSRTLILLILFVALQLPVVNVYAQQKEKQASPPLLLTYLYNMLQDPVNNSSSIFTPVQIEPRLDSLNNAMVRNKVKSISADYVIPYTSSSDSANHHIGIQLNNDGKITSAVVDYNQSYTFQYYKTGELQKIVSAVLEHGKPITNSDYLEYSYDKSGTQIKVRSVNPVTGKESVKPKVDTRIIVNDTIIVTAYDFVGRVTQTVKQYWDKTDSTQYTQTQSVDKNANSQASHTKCLYVKKIKGSADSTIMEHGEFSLRHELSTNLNSIRQKNDTADWRALLRTKNDSALFSTLKKQPIQPYYEPKFIYLSVRGRLVEQIKPTPKTIDFSAPESNPENIHFIYDSIGNLTGTVYTKTKGNKVSSLCYTYTYNSKNLIDAVYISSSYKPASTPVKKISYTYY